MKGVESKILFSSLFFFDASVFPYSLLFSPSELPSAFRCAPCGRASSDGFRRR